MDEKRKYEDENIGFDDEAIDETVEENDVELDEDDFEEFASDDVESSKKVKTDKSSDKKDEKKAKKESKFKRKWKALKKWQKTLIIIAVIIVLLALVGFITVYSIYGGFRAKINDKNLGISDETKALYADTGVQNVALFGLDSRGTGADAFKGRSDSIMIASIDPKNGTVKLTSILRDSYVAIEGHGSQKICHAYAFGGAELAIKTINQNFGMNITDYATINFFNLADAIDVLGGIDIEITKSEMEQINSEATAGTQAGVELLSDYGNVHLNGGQATIFVRLRKQDSDAARSDRQKKVVNALLVSARKVSPTKYAEVVKTLMSFCETSLSFTEMMNFVPMINMDLSIEAITIPGEPENAIGGIYDGAWVWRYDIAAAAQRMQEFIYGKVISTPTTTKSKTNDAEKNTTKAKKSDSTTVATTATTVKPKTGGETTSSKKKETTTEIKTTAGTTKAQEPKTELKTTAKAENKVPDAA